MMQKAEKNEEIEKIAGVFGNYIEKSPRLEWLWSGKLGYILLQLTAKKPETPDCRVIRDPEKLCRILAGEIAREVLEKSPADHDICDADPAEHMKISEQLRPYQEQLPEYAAVFTALTEGREP